MLIVVALAMTSACSDNSKLTQCDLPAVLVSDPASLDHEVDHKAMNSTSFDPQVARVYGIDQDDGTGVVMVSVYKRDAHGVGVESCVSGEVTNMNGQLQQLDFREIREGGAIYHIGTFPFHDKDHMTFDLDVQIAETGEKHEIKWRQQFWRE